MLIWGDSVEQLGIKIYPAKMRQYDLFYNNINCLMFQKNKVQDVRVLKMSYFDFLFGLIAQQNDIFGMLKIILDISLQDQSYDFYYSQDRTIVLKIEDKIINGYEFDLIRQDILRINGLKLDETLYDEDLEKSLKEAEEFASSRNGKMANTEERVVSYHCLSGRSYEEIADYTIYQFNKGLERFSIIKNFDTYSALLAENGASKDIQHWLCHIEEKGRFDDVIMTKDEFDQLTSDKDLFSR